MCTGDNIDTAIAISKEAGIITKDDEEKALREEDPYVWMTGTKFREATGGLEELEETEKGVVKKVKKVKNF